MWKTQTKGLLQMPGCRAQRRRDITACSYEFSALYRLVICRNINPSRETNKKLINLCKRQTSKKTWSFVDPRSCWSKDSDDPSAYFSKTYLKHTNTTFATVMRSDWFPSLFVLALLTVARHISFWHVRGLKTLWNYAGVLKRSSNVCDNGKNTKRVESHTIPESPTSQRHSLHELFS